MSRRRELDDGEIKALKALHAAAASGGGWRRGKVRGWLLGSEVNDRSSSSIASLSLQRLRNHGLVTGEPVHDPGRPGQSLVIWRITQRGEDALAAREGHAPIVIEPYEPSKRDAGIIYTARDAWHCLAVLQRHHPHWVKWADLVAEVRRRFGNWVYVDDTKLLLARGLAEREDEGEGRAKVIWLRATRLGAATQLADGAANPTLVQLRLPPAETAGG